MCPSPVCCFYICLREASGIRRLWASQSGQQSDVLFQVLDADFNAHEHVLHALELQRDIAVIAGRLDQAQALKSGNVALSEDGASDVVAASALEPAPAGFIGFYLPSATFLFV